ncbi:MAG: hypothetical protein M3T96_07815 [Acidobacteriota bacterium]|nr:hypothetical protein [Acidobacteriota bacterium]
MTRKKTLEYKKVPRSAPGRDSIPWKYCLLTLVCGTMLVAGFFFAARQHFSSIDFGIKNSRLRQQIENLEADKRRFLLAKEVALSPAEIKKAAIKLGFRETSFTDGEIIRPVSEAKEKLKTAIIEKLSPVVEVLPATKKEAKKPEQEIKKDAGKAAENKDKSKSQITRK